MEYKGHNLDIKVQKEILRRSRSMCEMTRLEIERLLDEARIGRLCMAAPDGTPYSVPFPFCWADGSLYLRVAMTGRKGEILSLNDRVCFGVDAYTDMLDDYASVLIEGRLAAVSDAGEKERIRAMNSAKYNRLRRGYRPGHGRSTPIGDLPLRKIVVERVSGRRKESEPRTDEEHHGRRTA
jgi:nitroimidazol reductase NimA-like FMN-containing flavoprotein (pyridoxamine 5'-phosphate oxidase superfamily)